MASLRDVFNHAGKRAQVERAGRPVGEALAMVRGPLVLLEPKVEPLVGDRVTIDGASKFEVLAVSAEHHLGKLDHFRLQVRPIA